MPSVPPERIAAAARANVPPFYVMDLIAAADRRARSHGDLVNMTAGQPSTPAPEPVRRRAIELLSGADSLGYTMASGIPELREAIAGHYQRTAGLQVDPDDVIITTGASGAFPLAFLAAFDVGDRVAMASPGYPCYRNILQALGCEVVELACGPENRFQPRLAQLTEIENLAGVIIASPANPTGTMLEPSELAAIASWCSRQGVQLISDEIYHGIEYAPLLGEPSLASSAWHTSREAIVINSFSKYFSMTGWRIGWMLVPQRLRRTIDVLAGNFTICPPAIAQHAAVEAFTEESYAELDGHVRRYADNRAALLAGLPTLGITKLAPADGAFYAYADVSHLTDDSLSFTHALIDDCGVAIAPGVDFDTVAGSRFVRFSFAGSAWQVEEGLARLARSPMLRRSG